MSNPFEGAYVFQYTLNRFRVPIEDRDTVFQCVVSDCPSYEWARAEAHAQRHVALERFNKWLEGRVVLVIEDIESQAIALNVVLCDLLAREMRAPDGKPFSVDTRKPA